MNDAVNLISLLELNAQNFPDDIAYRFITSDGEEQILSFSNLNEEVKKLACFILEKNVENEPIILVLSSLFDFVISFLSVLRAGSIAVPTNIVHFNSRYLDRFISIIKDSNAKLILTDNKRLSALREWVAKTTLNESISIQSINEIYADYSKIDRRLKLKPNSAAFLQYTSGSTGKPKGVIVSHQNIIENSRIISETFDTSKDSIIGGWLPLYHDMGLVGHVIHSLYVGAQSIIMPSSRFIREPHSWLEMISKYKVTTSGAPNFAYDYCVDKIQIDTYSEYDLSSWQVAYNGSEQVHYESMRRFSEKFQSIGFNTKAFRPCYGMAEATLMVTGDKSELETYVCLDRNELAEGRAQIVDADQERAQLISSVGLLNKEYDFKIINPKTLMPSEPGEIGELWISGNSIACGYWKNIEKTEETFRAKMPNDTENKQFLRTGDLGFIHDKQLYITGRLKELIIVNGSNYYPQDIERAIQHANIAFTRHSGVAVSVGSDRQEHLLIIQELSKKEIRSANLDELVKQITQVLSSEFQLSAYDIVLVKPASIPKTTSGKIKRLTTKKMYLSSELESRTIYSMKKNHSFNDVNTDNVDQFFEQIANDNPKLNPQRLIDLGLDSLQVAQLITKIENKFSVRFDYEVDYLEWTVSELKQHIKLLNDVSSNLENAENANRFNLPVSLNEGSQVYKLNSIQKAIYSISKIDKDKAVYNIGLAFFSEHIKPSAFLKALRYLYQENPILSSQVTHNDITGEAFLNIDASRNAKIQIENGEKLDEDSILALFNNESDKPFLLDNDPLISFFLVQGSSNSPGKSYLLIRTHHILFDHYSIELLVKRLDYFYSSLINLGNVSETSFKCYQYKNNIPEEEELLKTEKYSEALSDIQKNITNTVTNLPLPIDKPRQLHQTFKSDSFQITLTPEISKRVRGHAKKCGVTPYIYFLSMFQVLISNITEQNRFIIGTPTLGRYSNEDMFSIGNYANPVLIFSDFDQMSSKNFEQILSNAKRVVDDAFSKRFVPFSSLVNKLKYDRDRSRSPLIQAMFVWHSRFLEKNDRFFKLMDMSQLRGAPDELSFIVVDNMSQFDITLNYCEDLFYKETIEKISEYYLDIISMSLDNHNFERYRQSELLAEILNKPYLQDHILRSVLEHDQVSEVYFTAESTVSNHEKKILYVKTKSEISSVNLINYLKAYVNESYLPDIIVPVTNIPLLQSDPMMINYEEMGKLPKVNDYELEKLKRLVKTKFGDIAVNYELIPKLINKRLPEQSPPTYLKLSPEKLKYSVNETPALVIGETISSLKVTDIRQGFLNTVHSNPSHGITIIKDNTFDAIFLSYKDLLVKAKNILAYLQSKDISSGDYLIIQLDNLLEYFPVFWGCILGGVIPITIAPAVIPDRENSVYRKLKNAFLQHSKPYIIASPRIEENLLNIDEDLFKSNILSSATASSACGYKPNLDIELPEVAFCQLSSGSTGVSKSIQVRHESIAQYVVSSTMVNGYTSSDISCNWLSMDHVVPLLTFHIKDTLIGSNQVQLPANLILSKPLFWFDIIEKFKVTHTWSPNFGYKLVNEAFHACNDNVSWDLSSIKHFMNAGEQTTHQVINDFIHVIENFGGSAKMMQTAYGMAEMCTVIVSVNDFDPSAHELSLKKCSLSESIEYAESGSTKCMTFVSQGNVYPGLAIRIADMSNQQLNENMVGRIQVKGNTMTLGYLNNTKANEEAFIGDGWYNTGDIGFINNQQLFISGREKEIIIINGANYHCYEIEEVVSTVEGVKPTFVAACGHINKKTGTEGLIIFYCEDESTRRSSERITADITEKVSKVFGILVGDLVKLDINEFSKTTSGKIQREKMKSEYIQVMNENLNMLNLDEIIFRPAHIGEPIRQLTAKEVFNGVIVINDAFLVADVQEMFPEVLPKNVIIFDKELNDNRVKFGDAFETLIRNNCKKVAVIDLNRSSNYNDINIDKNALFDDVDRIIHLMKVMKSFGSSFDGINYFGLLIRNDGDELVLSNTLCFSVITSLVRSLKPELENLQVKLIEVLGHPRKYKNILSTEFHCNDDEEMIVYGDNGRRCLPSLEHITKLENEKKSVLLAGNILLVGGFGGIGKQLLTHLLTRNEKTKILVLGRRKLAEIAEVADEYSSYFESGRLRYESVNSVSTEEIKSAVHAFKTKLSVSSIDAIIDLSGELDSCSLIDLTTERFLRYVQKKSELTLHLINACESNDKLSLITFSSVNGFFPGSYSSSYSAACAYLNVFQEYISQKYPNIISYTLGWSFWQGIGMSKDTARAEFAKNKGFLPINIDLALSAIDLISSYKPGTYLIGLNPSNFNISRYLRTQAAAYGYIKLSCSKDVVKRKLQQYFNRQPLNDMFGNSYNELIELSVNKIKPTEIEISEKDEVKNSEYKYLMSKIRSIWIDKLGNEEFSNDTNFFEAGGDSIQAVQIITEIQTITDKQIDVVELFNYPTVKKLAEYLSNSKEENVLSNVIKKNTSRSARHKRLSVIQDE